MMKILIGPLEENLLSQPFLRVSIIFKKVPLAANPKRAMLMTMKDRWFHWLMAKTLVRSTSKARDESDSKKTAVSIMEYCQ